MFDDHTFLCNRKIGLEFRYVIPRIKNYYDKDYLNYQESSLHTCPMVLVLVLWINIGEAQT